MDIKPVNSITFEENGKKYCLEYDRDSVLRMESAGFKPGNSGETPMLELTMLWAGAFYKHHRSVSSNMIEKLLNTRTNKSKLLEKLRDMFSETYNSVFNDDIDDEDNEGNANWTASL